MRRFLLAGASLLASGTMSTPASSQSQMPSAPASQVLGARSTAILDSLAFGDAASEQAHALATPAGQSDVVAGALGQSARRLLPPPTAGWQGGRVSFTMKVDAARPNFFTARFWGGEGNEGRLILFAEGKQVGWNHIGDTDQLDFGSEKGAPPTPGRFFTKTLPLPLALTQGKTQLHLEIRAIGRIWAYGTSFEQYQKPMEVPSRGLYRVYTHADGFFVPPASEQPGAAGTAKIPLRLAPGPEVLAALRERVGGEVSRYMARDRPLNQMEMLFLARAYAIKWTPAYQNAAALDKIIAGLDSLFAAYRANPKLAQEDPATPNPDWFGLGPSGNVISLLAEQIRPRLDGRISDGAGGNISRRVAFAEMLVATRDWHREHRRQYTNQSMINDLYGIYLANRGLQVVDSSQALPEARALRYLYESVGLEPWLGSEKDGVPAKPLGDKYLQLTDKGLTKELGEGDTLRSAQEGEELPIAQIPPGADFKIGKESPYAGRAEFYQMRYGPYLIAMNTTRARSFTLEAPRDMKRARDLKSRRAVKPGATLQVGPMSTLVLYDGP